MSKKPTTAKTATSTETRYDAFSVREYQVAGETRSEWTKVGVAFANKDGKGFNLLLQAFPVDGKVTVRLHEEKADSAE
jgi:hypothetical protein